MTKQKILRFSLLAVLLMLIGSGCGQYDTDVGGGLVSSDQKGVIKELVVPVDSVAIRTGGDGYKSMPANIPLGIQSGFTSDIILRFTEFAVLEDTLFTWSSAAIHLFGNGFVDAPEIMPIVPWSAGVYRIDSEWDPLDISYSDTLEMTLLEIAEIGTSESFDEAIIPLDSLTLQRWIEDTLAYGVRIRPQADANFLKQFSSASGSDPAKLPTLVFEGVYQQGDSLIDTTLTAYTDVSTFLAHDDVDLPDSLLFVTEGYARSMLFWKDVDGLLPENVSVNLVELLIHASPSPLTFGDVDYLSVFDVTNEWFADPDSAAYGTGSGRIYAVDSDTSFIRLDVTPLAWLWFSDPESNHGLAVRSSDDNKLIGRRAFHGPDASQTDFRPRLRFVYTEFATP